MGALMVGIGLVSDNSQVMGANISDMYIWRDEAKEHDDDWLTYNVSRTAPGLIHYEEHEEFSLVGGSITHNYPVERIVMFRHKYSDGAELCVARAIMALQEAGLNK